MTDHKHSWKKSLDVYGCPGCWSLNPFTGATISQLIETHVWIKGLKNLTGF